MAVVNINGCGHLVLWRWPSRGHDESFWVRSCYKPISSMSQQLLTFYCFLHGKGDALWSHTSTLNYYWSYIAYSFDATDLSLSLSLQGWRHIYSGELSFPSPLVPFDHPFPFFFPSHQKYRPIKIQLGGSVGALYKLPQWVCWGAPVEIEFGAF